MWTHRERCNNCDWRGYHSDLRKRELTNEERENKYDKEEDIDGENTELKEKINRAWENVGYKKYICCPKCGSLDVVGHEIDDSHLQGI